MSVVDYEHLGQWRDICEYLEGQWYKFVDGNNASFSLLLPSSKQLRSQLWSEYMIQFVCWGSHPYSHYHNGRDARRYGKILGWRLTFGWEAKIDFLEKIVLFHRAPEDLSQPWRRAIWESFFHRQETDAAVQAESQRRMEQSLEEIRARGLSYRLKMDACKNWLNLQSGECPITGSCHAMSGVFMSKDCPNFLECERLWKTM